MSNILPIGKWGWVLAGSWVEWLVMLPKVLRQAQDERGVGSVVWFAFCRARGALLQGSSREWFFGVFCVLPECAQKIRHQPVSGFAAGRDACGRAWGQEAPARPGESRWRLGPGFGWEVGWCGGLVFCSRPFYRLRAYMVSSHCASNFVDVLSGLLSYIRPVLEVQPLALMIMRAYCPLRTVGL